jgi:hypothetical protein
MFITLLITSSKKIYRPFFSFYTEKMSKRKCNLGIREVVVFLAELRKTEKGNWFGKEGDQLH